MSTWYERYDSGEAQIKRAGHTDISTFKKVWIVKSVEDYTQAHEDFLQNLEGIEGTLQGPLGTYYFAFDGYSAKHLGNGLWEVEANYQTLGGGQQPIANDGGGGGGGGGNGGGQPAIGVIVNITFDSTGGTQHITSALSESRYGAGAPDMKKAINVTADSVEGCDITVPVFEWSEEYEIPGAAMTPAYLKQVADLTGTVNDATFRTFPKGEVLFLGFQGSQTFNPNASTLSEASVAKMSYRFARNKNKKDETKPDVGQAYDKEGWEYVWVHYDKDVDGKTPLAVPKWLYVNQVYEYGDFKNLRLPLT